MATKIVTATVIDFNAALAARRAREAEESRRAEQVRRARPLRTRLLKRAVAAMSPAQRGALHVTITDGVVHGVPTESLVRALVRDQVRQKAHAAL